MSYQVITDFRGGLDARKFRLSLPPGTLTSLVNGHITQGGEIEKRKAFVRLVNPNYDYSLPSGTFGFQESKDGIVVFIGADIPGILLPTNFTYQKLQHPAVINGTTYDPAKHAMTAIVHSCVFGDLVFAVAQFADGYTFAYWNAQLVTDFTDGLILPYLDTTAKITTALVNAINDTVNYTAAQGNGSADSEMDVYSQPGNDYTASNTVSGVCNIAVVSNVDVDYQTSNISATNGDNAADGDTLVIGEKTYRFKTYSVIEGDVTIGLRIKDTMLNLFNAINHTGTPGADYSCAAANANVAASAFIATNLPSFTATARVANVNGETENTISGDTYLQVGASVSQTNSTKSAGQFKINALAAGTSVSATGTISTTGTAPSNLDTVTVGTKVYRFKSLSVGMVANDVYIGASSNAAFDNLSAAINATPQSGPQYGIGTTPNTLATASARVGSGASAVITITAISGGAGGNSIVLSDTSTPITTPGTLSGGVSNGLSALAYGPTFASGKLVTNGTNPSDGDTVVIGSKTYTFKTTLTPSDGQVVIGARAIDTLKNLIYAVNLTGILNVNYYVISKHPQVKALPTVTGSTVTIIALVAGTSGNSIAMSSSTATITADADLSGGQTSVNLIASTVQISTNSTPTSYANDVASAINAYTATSGFTATAADGIVFMTAAAGNSLENDAIVTSTVVGQCCIDFCGFQFSDGGAYAGSTAHVDVRINGFSILSATVGTSGVTKIETLVANIATNINDPSNVINNGVYCAVASGVDLYISRVTCASNEAPATASIMVDTTGILAVSQIGIGSLAAAVTPLTVRFIRKNNVTAESSPIVVTCQASGGYPPYAYNWEYVSGADGFMVQNQGSPSTTFARHDNAGSNSARWACRVTDSNNNSVLSNSVNVYQP